VTILRLVGKGPLETQTLRLIYPFSAAAAHIAEREVGSAPTYPP